jgi:hypothetical protein
LPVRAGAHLHNLADVFDFFAAIEFVEHVIDEGEIFFDEIALGNFHLLAEVDQFPLMP